MRTSICIILILLGTLRHSQTAGLPIWNESIVESVPQTDWLVKPASGSAAIYTSKDQDQIILYNGLLKRTFQLSPNLACVQYRNMTTGQELLRAVMPEATVELDGKEYAVGGLLGQRERGYLLMEWIDSLHRGENDFQFDGYEVEQLTRWVAWKPAKWATNNMEAKGKQIAFRFRSPVPALKGITVRVHYTIYDGLPLLTKWVTIDNDASPIRLGQVKHELLAMVEEESAVIGSIDRMKKPQGIYVETNYAYNNAMRYDISDQSTHWKVDSLYTSQVNYNFQTPCLLEIYPAWAPGIDLNKGDHFVSIHSHELLQDSYDRERRGLAVRRMYRDLMPWTTANPIFMHLVSKDDEEVKTAIDQCVATGYEAVILSFGSHCNMEDTAPTNIKRWKELADYAHKKGVKLGGYALFSSRRISDEDDVVDPLTGKPGGAFFGNAPCFGSKWGIAFRDKIISFYEKTGFDIWENDGPYPGDVCASTTHPGHKGLDDSQWRQMEMQKQLYRSLSASGVYINAPDWYFMDGTNKIAIGYREVNFSLPRENQKILNRQNIFDGTWEKTPSMGWGFVPLTRYQGGGPEAILEPLHAHRKDYEQLMMQYYGAGVQACYRGPRLYDTDETRELVKGVVKWYKQYRTILNADIIHLRRADGRDWDGIMHVDPAGKEKALVMLYNPLNISITRTIEIPMYYSGLTNGLTIREKEGKKSRQQLNRGYGLELAFKLDPQSYTWFVIEP